LLKSGASTHGSRIPARSLELLIEDTDAGSDVRPPVPNFIVGRCRVCDLKQAHTAEVIAAEQGTGANKLTLRAFVPNHLPQDCALYRRGNGSRCRVRAHNRNWLAVDGV
jgi:hypothetical protein